MMHDNGRVASADASAAERRRQLTQDGFLLVQDVLPPETVTELQRATLEEIGKLSREHLERHRSMGSSIPSGQMPQLADLIAWPAALRVLDDLGLSDSRFWSGYVISKPPDSPPLFWHQDGIVWSDPRSYTDLPPMLFFMYYLVDTTRENGCLRVIPGTHRRRHPLHDAVEVAHTDAIRRIDNPDSPAYATAEGEVDVPMRAGDLLVGDARILHASHANRSSDWRTVITLWYLPEYAGLSEESRCFYGNSSQDLHRGWPADALERVDGLLASYEGPLEAAEMNRIPGPEFT